MRRVLVLMAGAIAALAAATTMASTPAASTPSGNGSGVAGRAVAGPTCPVERYPPDPRCAPRPLSVRIQVLPQGHYGRAVTVRSGRDGRFRVAEPPGSYLVRGLAASSSGFPRPPSPSRVRVSSGHFTSVTLNYDTGIR